MCTHVGEVVALQKTKDGKIRIHALLEVDEIEEEVSQEVSEEYFKQHPVKKGTKYRFHNVWQDAWGFSFNGYSEIG